jgi:flagellar basal-body rod protein FlgB
MGPVHLFELVSQRNEWLSVRQSLVAGNVANANTPGFKAKDVVPFEAVLNRANLEQSMTQEGHLKLGMNGVADARESKNIDGLVLHSGNSVSIEAELLKAGEVSRQHRLATSVMKSFHRMMLSTTRG